MFTLLWFWDWQRPDWIWHKLEPSQTVLSLLTTWVSEESLRTEGQVLWAMLWVGALTNEESSARQLDYFSRWLYHSTHTLWYSVPQTGKRCHTSGVTAVLKEMHSAAMNELTWITNRVAVALWSSVQGANHGQMSMVHAFNKLSLHFYSYTAIEIRVSLNLA